VTTKAVIAIFAHLEDYPPTLNALRELSTTFDRVEVLYRPYAAPSWVYPANVRLHACGPCIDAAAQRRLPLARRYGLLLRFAQQLSMLLRSAQPDLILLYDPLSVLAFSLIRSLAGKQALLWYHNHDVVDVDTVRRFSLAWLAHQAERRLFSCFDMFSLPAEERKDRFPLHRFKGAYFFLPNYPSKKVFGPLASKPAHESVLRVIFQGSVGPGHGIESLMELLPCEIGGRRLHLVVKGRCEAAYHAALSRMIAARELDEHVTLVGYSSYQELVTLTRSCHVGIAIHTGDDPMNRTLGTASNKIYEYAAAGLPILYYDNPHFRRHLSHFSWAVPTDVSPASLKKALESVAASLDSMSAAARADFEEQLTFERFFDGPMAFLRERLPRTASL
jgi:hypothetical protein